MNRGDGEVAALSRRPVLWSDNQPTGGLDSNPFHIALLIIRSAYAQWVVIVTIIVKLNVAQSSQETPCLLCRQKVHYLVHNSPATFPILSRKNAVLTFTMYFTSVRSILVFNLSQDVSTVTVFQLNIYTHFSYLAWLLYVTPTLHTDILRLCRIKYKPGV
jgi:hypothetical protein